eukprot:Tamp_06960.p1 GENE.Tamp_06960~~Tamp_06960.p1  ORF type:complete len:449 (+),score=61.56 Tamp_06960:152-1348(+)
MNSKPKTETSGINVGDVERTEGAMGQARLLACLALAVAAGVHCKSATLAGALIFATFLDFASDFICGAILKPPFHDPKPHALGHSTDPRKICPYWSAATIAGPAACGLTHVDITIPADLDGEHTLRAWLFEASDAAQAGQETRQTRKRTLIIQSHGAGRDRRSWLRHTPFLLKAGYTCISFDFTDHGTSDRADGVVSRQGSTLGLRESRDIARVVRFCRLRFPDHQLVLMGTSTGASASVIALASDHLVRQHVICLVAENPFSSIPAITWDTVKNLVFKTVLCKNSTALFVASWPMFAVITPLVVLKAILRLRAEGYFRTLSCYAASKLCTTPSFIMHGLADNLVPIEHSQRLEAGAARGAGFIKQTWYLPAAGHCQVWDTSPAEFERRVLAFLSEYC